MRPEECERHALDCVEKAARAKTHAISSDFRMLAAQWRAMAVHKMYFNQAVPL